MVQTEILKDPCASDAKAEDVIPVLEPQPTPCVPEKISEPKPPESTTPPIEPPKVESPPSIPVAPPKPKALGLAVFKERRELLMATAGVNWAQQCKKCHSPFRIEYSFLLLGNVHYEIICLMCGELSDGFF